MAISVTCRSGAPAAIRNVATRFWISRRGAAPTSRAVTGDLARSCRSKRHQFPLVSLSLGASQAEEHRGGAPLRFRGQRADYRRQIKLRRGRHACKWGYAALLAGRSNSKQVPSLGTELTVMRLPCRSRILRTIARPRPAEPFRPSSSCSLR